MRAVPHFSYLEKILHVLTPMYHLPSYAIEKTESGIPYVAFTLPLTDRLLADCDSALIERDGLDWVFTGPCGTVCANPILELACWWLQGARIAVAA